MTLTAIGIVLGVLGAIGLTRYLDGMLYQFDAARSGDLRCRPNVVRFGELARILSASTTSDDDRSYDGAEMRLTPVVFRWKYKRHVVRGVGYCHII